MVEESGFPAVSIGMRMRGADVRVLAIPGSLREQSYNRSLLRAAQDLAPRRVTISVYDKLEDVPLFNEDVADRGTPRGVSELRQALANTDGVLIATPEYNQAVPGVVKNMIDWLSLGQPEEGLEGRPVAVTGITTGPWGTRLAQTMLRQMLVSTQAVLLPQPSLYLRNAESLFDEAGNLTDPTTALRLGELVAAFADWIRIIRNPSALSESQGIQSAAPLVALASP